MEKDELRTTWEAGVDRFADGRPPGAPLVVALAAKLPGLDLTWPEEWQAVWWRAVERLRESWVASSAERHAAAARALLDVVNPVEMPPDVQEAAGLVQRYCRRRASEAPETQKGRQPLSGPAACSVQRYHPPPAPAGGLHGRSSMTDDERDLLLTVAGTVQALCSRLEFLAGGLPAIREHIDHLQDRVRAAAATRDQETDPPG